MVRPVDQDARGIVAPARGLGHFRLDRFPPSAAVARFVDRYWIATWDLRGRPSYTQSVLAHPVVNVVFSSEDGTVNGVTTRMTYRTLEGAGRVLGVMFRPAGFRPLLGRPMSVITDETFPACDILGTRVGELARSIAADTADAELSRAADDLLSSVLPPTRQPSEETTAIVEQIAADRTLVRVAQLASLAGVSARQLQRLFSDHVGVTPKGAIRRYRIYDAAERARELEKVDWAGLAAELGYSDQPHFTRDFSDAMGMPLERYAQFCRG